MDEGTSRLTGVDLYWVPLGAGDHIVRVSGKLYEALKGISERRPRTDLYHSALEITLPGDRFIIESAPIPDLRGSERGVVAEGPVGVRWLGRFRLFRYEIRSWRGGAIPDVSYAVASPVRVSTDVEQARRVIELVPRVPDAGVGSGRAGDRGYVELELRGFLAPRASGRRDRRATPTGRRPSSGLGGRTHRRSAPSRTEPCVNEVSEGCGF